MSAEGQITDLWKVTSGIRSDVSELLVSVARLEEREQARKVEAQVQGTRLESLEKQLRTLDRKIAAAMGMVLLIAWGLQLLVPAM